MNINDYGYNYYSADRFWSRFDEIQSIHPAVEILAGIEFGEPHLYEKYLKELAKYPYDFVIGSVHWIGDMFPCQKVREQYSAKEFYTLYCFQGLERYSITHCNC